MRKREREREKARAAELWSVERRGFLAVFYSIGLLTAIPAILGVCGSNHFAEITPSFWQWHQDLSKSRRDSIYRDFCARVPIVRFFPCNHKPWLRLLLGRLVIVINNEFRKSSECCKLKKEWLQNYNKRCMFLPLSTRNASSRKK